MILSFASPRMTARTAFAAMALAVLAGCSPAEDGADGSTASGRSYPSRPIRVVVPFGPGGLADVTMRIASEHLGASMGEPWVVENRPGAGGVAATTTMLNATADGHTLIVLTNGTSIAETLFAPLPYTISADLVPISTVALFDLAILTSTDSGLNDLAAAIERGLSPEGVTIATINAGSTQHLSAELFRVRTGINARVIPYRTSPEVLGALLRGEVDLAVEAYTALKGAIDGGEVKTLAVTGPVRNPGLPDVPTATEAGVEDYVVTGWNSLYVRTGTPPEVIETLNREVLAVVFSPEVQAAFADLGVEARGSTPEEAAARLAEDIERWRAVIEAAGISTQ